MILEWRVYFNGHLLLFNIRLFHSSKTAKRKNRGLFHWSYKPNYITAKILADPLSNFRHLPVARWRQSPKSGSWQMKHKGY